MEMTYYQNFLVALIAVLQILLTSYSCVKEDFWIFALSVTTLCLLILFIATLGG